MSDIADRYGSERVKLTSSLLSNKNTDLVIKGLRLTSSMLANENRYGSERVKTYILTDQ